jgi:hypothetical protein
MAVNPKLALIALLLLAALHGAGTEYYLARNLEPSAAFTLVVTALFVVLCYLWYQWDSRQRSYQRTTLHGSLVVLLPPVGVAYYLYRSRPQNHRIRSVFKAAGFLVLFFVLSVATGISLQVLGEA